MNVMTKKENGSDREKKAKDGSRLLNKLRDRQRRKMNRERYIESVSEKEKLVR